MLYGIQATQDVKLSVIARSLQENIALIKTEDRLSRNLAAEALDVHLLRRLAEMGSRRVTSQTVLCRDLSDVRKEYAQKMEFLDRVHDGSTGEVHEGYWLCEVTGAEVHGNEIVPLCQKLYSTKAPDFYGENAELLGAVDWVGTFARWRGIWAMDRGGDRRHGLEPRQVHAMAADAQGKVTAACLRPRSTSPRAKLCDPHWNLNLYRSYPA
jgi:hypothetical protein